MAKLNVQEFELTRPISRLMSFGLSGTYFGPETKRWSGIADEDTGVFVLRVKGLDGKSKSFRLPLATVFWYVATGQVPGDEPADPR